MADAGCSMQEAQMYSEGRICISTCKYDYHLDKSNRHPCPHAQVPFFLGKIIENHSSPVTVTAYGDIICASDNSIHALSNIW